MAQRYGYNIQVSPQAAAHAAVDLFEMAEINAIRELAVKVHQDGMQFVGWPRFDRVRLVFDSQSGLIEADKRHGDRVDMWQVRALVVAVPRAL